jgi:hemoglobin
MESLYEHAGGDDALHRLEEIFYEKALADPILKVLFTERVPTHVEHLTWFTAESFGGPDRFTQRLGFQYIIDVHRHLNITDEQRDRFVALYLDSLDEAGLPDDEPFRQAVRSHVEFGAQVAYRNSRAETDADLHPIRAVPSWQWPTQGDGGGGASSRHPTDSKR